MKEYRIIVTEEEFVKLPHELKLRAEAYFNDYDDHKEDPLFKRLYMDYKHAKKELEIYKFNKRHGGNT